MVIVLSGCMEPGKDIHLGIPGAEFLTQLCHYRRLGGKHISLQLILTICMRKYQRAQNTDIVCIPSPHIRLCSFRLCHFCYCTMLTKLRTKLACNSSGVGNSGLGHLGSLKETLSICPPKGLAHVLLECTWM